MRKSVLSILTFCFVFMSVLAFSCPVFAKTFSNYEDTKTVRVTVSGSKTQIGFTDASGTYVVKTFAQPNTAFIRIPLTFKVPLFNLNGDAQLYADNNVMEFSSQSRLQIVSASASNFGHSSYSLKNLCVVINGQSFPFVDNTFVRYFADVSSFYTSGVPVNDVLFYTCDFCLTLASQSEDTTFSCNVVLSLGADSAEFKPSVFFYDSGQVYRSDITNQTTQINNNITQQTQQQTESLQNGYDNSSMSQDNTRLNDQISQYDQAQEETTNKSTAYIDGAEFVNPFSNATVLASVTFATSFLQSLFMNLDIWQLVVTVSLCLVLALMLVGWFKFRGD